MGGAASPGKQGTCCSGHESQGMDQNVGLRGTPRLCWGAEGAPGRERELGMGLPGLENTGACGKLREKAGINNFGSIKPRPSQLCGCRGERPVQAPLAPLLPTKSPP